MSGPAPDLSPRALLERYHRAMLDKDADAFAELYAPDAVHEFPLLSPFFPRLLKGREAIRERYRAVWGAAPIVLLEIREVAVHETRDPKVIVAESEYSAREVATDNTFALSFVIVMRVDDGLIVHLRDYMDALGAAAALDRVQNLADAMKRDRSR